jgi:hypothetical protein
MKNSRRPFLRNMSIAGSGMAALGSSGRLSDGLAEAKSGHGKPKNRPQFEKGSIRISNPRRLGVDRLAVERVAVGQRGHYKPSIVKLDGEELLMVCYNPDVKGPVYNPSAYQYRSTDGGCTWAGPELRGFLTTILFQSLMRSGCGSLLPESFTPSPGLIPAITRFRDGRSPR